MSALPVASAREVRSRVWHLLRRYPGAAAGALALHALAAASGLVGPRLLGDIVENARRGVDDVTRAALLIGVFVAAQAVLTSVAVYVSARLGERILADLREEFVDRVLALPLATVERAGSGDLITRTTRDVDVLLQTVRYAVPDAAISIATIVITLGGVVLVGPLLAVPCLIAVPALWGATRWYLRRGRAAFLARSASHAQLTEGLTETVQGARTVEALRIAHRRFERVNTDIAASFATQRYVLNLQTVYVPTIDVAYIMAIMVTLVVGGLFYVHNLASLAAVTAATLYVQQVLGPVDYLLFRLAQLQEGGASLARLLGADRIESRPTPAGVRPRTEDIGVHGVCFAYREGRDVLHDIDLDVRPGERLAIVGPSGAGKSTLGRLLAGIHPPRTGAVTVDGVPLTDLPPDELRRQVALVTQEHHVFRGTLRDNLVMARPDTGDDDMEQALKAVDAWDWVTHVGLDTEVGSGGYDLSPAQAQQLALARLALADPHTLILDEATSLLDPRAARHLERSLAAVLEGRTVIAIAHRLHTAHDADRVAVMDDGRIVELGSHDELVRQGGAYAALWESWHGR
jgi:ABC-type multidrug transport system fused ATPase/permease subunit